MDRDKNILKRTRDAAAAAAAAAEAEATAEAVAMVAIAVKEKKKSALLNETTNIPNPKPQISTPVPSTANTNTEKNQRISLMSDSQIMERLRKVFYIKDKCMISIYLNTFDIGSVVTSGDPNLLYKRTKRIGQG